MHLQRIPSSVGMKAATTNKAEDGDRIIRLDLTFRVEEKEIIMLAEESVRIRLGGREPFSSQCVQGQTGEHY